MVCSERISGMMALRLPFFSRLMVVELRLERLCSREYFPALVSDKSLEELHSRALSRREMDRRQIMWDREKVYSGSMMLR